LCGWLQEYMTRVVDAPPTGDPVFDETFSHEVPPTVEVLDDLAADPLLVMVFDCAGSDERACAGLGCVYALCVYVCVRAGGGGYPTHLDTPPPHPLRSCCHHNRAVSQVPRPAVAAR